MQTFGVAALLAGCAPTTRLSVGRCDPADVRADLLERGLRAVTAPCRGDGVQWHTWSPDGRRVLVGAGRVSWLDGERHALTALALPARSTGPGDWVGPTRAWLPTTDGLAEVDVSAPTATLLPGQLDRLAVGTTPWGSPPTGGPRPVDPVTGALGAPPVWDVGPGAWDAVGPWLVAVGPDGAKVIDTRTGATAAAVAALPDGPWGPFGSLRDGLVTVDGRWLMLVADGPVVSPLDPTPFDGLDGVPEGTPDAMRRPATVPVWVVIDLDRAAGFFSADVQLDDLEPYPVAGWLSGRLWGLGGRAAFPAVVIGDLGPRLERLAEANVAGTGFQPLGPVTIR